MKISVLSDNHAGPSTPAEHGLSYFVEYDDQKLLFDTGQSDLFLRNAAKMKVDVLDAGTVILSHGHFDHGNGLEFVNGKMLICHPLCFVKRYGKRNNNYIGLKYSPEEISRMFDLKTSYGPFLISEHIFFLGEIPRITSFESVKTKFILEDGSPDFVNDDSALALVLSQGLFIITGCGHAGIVNTLEYAKKVAGINTLYGVMGGFHLKEEDEQTKETIRYLDEHKVRHILPSHCTELPALAAFHRKFGITHVKTGYVFDF